MTAPALSDLLPLLRDPVDGGTLALRDQVLHGDGDGDGRDYPVRDGVPVLLHPSSPFAGVAVDARDAQERPVAARLGAWLSRQRSRNLAARHACARLLDELRREATDRPARVLVIGGRVEGPGLALLADAPGVELIETDVVLGPRTRLICDAHHLPFADASVDAVIAQAVMEHVADPGRVATEVHRVLAPSGLVYADTPFLQHVHEGAYDFTRFTLGGHRRLWRWFDEVEAGVSGGPGMALAWAIRGTARVVAGRSRVGRATALVVASLAGAVLTRLDPWLVRRPGAADAACATWFLGRRRTSPLTDQEIIARYDDA